MKLYSFVLILVVALSASADCGCLNCNKHLRVVSAPNAPITVVYRGEPCYYPRSLAYNVELPTATSNGAAYPLRSYGYKVQEMRVEKPIAKQAVLYKHGYKVEVPQPDEEDVAKHYKYFINLVAKPDRVVMPAPEVYRLPAPCAKGPIIQYLPKCERGKRDLRRSKRRFFRVPERPTTKIKTIDGDDQSGIKNDPRRDQKRQKVATSHFVYPKVGLSFPFRTKRSFSLRDPLPFYQVFERRRDRRDETPEDAPRNRPYLKPFDVESIFPHDQLFYFVNFPIRALNHFRKLKDHVSPMVESVPKVASTSTNYLMLLGKRLRRNTVDLLGNFLGGLRLRNWLKKNRRKRDLKLPRPKQSDGMNQMGLSREEMNREESNREELNQEDLNPGYWNREDLNPENWNQVELNRKESNQVELNQKDLNPENEDQGDFNPEDRNQEDLNSEDWNQEDLNPEDWNQEDLYPEDWNRVELNRKESNQVELNQEKNMMGNIAINKRFERDLSERITKNLDVLRNQNRRSKPRMVSLTNEWCQDEKVNVKNQKPPRLLQKNHNQEFDVESFDRQSTNEGDSKEVMLQGMDREDKKRVHLKNREQPKQMDQSQGLVMLQEMDQEDNKGMHLKNQERLKQRNQSKDLGRKTLGKQSNVNSYKEQLGEDKHKEDKPEKQSDDDQSKGRSNEVEFKEQSSEDKSKERSNEDKSKEQSSEHKFKEKSDENKSKEQLHEDKSKEQSGEDKIKERSDENKSKELLYEDNSKKPSNDDKSKERSNEDKIKEQSNKGTFKGQSDEDKSKEQSSEHKFKGKSDENKSKGQLHEDKSKENPDEDKIKEQSGENKSKVLLNEEKSKKQSDEDQPNKQSNKSKSKERLNKEKSKGQSNEDKSKEQSNGDKFKEKSNEDKSREQSNVDKSKEQSNENRYKKQLNDVKSKGQSNEDKCKKQSNEDLFKEHSNKDKYKENSNNDKVKENSNQDKSKEQSDEDKSKEQSKKSNPKEQLDPTSNELLNEDNSGKRSNKNQPKGESNKDRCKDIFDQDKSKESLNEDNSRKRSNKNQPKGQSNKDRCKEVFDQDKSKGSLNEDNSRKRSSKNQSKGQSNKDKCKEQSDGSQPKKLLNEDKFKKIPNEDWSKEKSRGNQFKERLSRDKSKEQSDEDKPKEQSDGDEFKEQSDDRTSREQSDEDKSKELDQDKSKELLNKHKSNNDKSKKQSGEYQFKERSNKGKSKEQSDADKSKEQSDADKSKKQSDADKSKKQSDEGKSKEQSNEDESKKQVKEANFNEFNFAKEAKFKEQSDRKIRVNSNQEFPERTNRRHQDQRLRTGVSPNQEKIRGGLKQRLNGHQTMEQSKRRRRKQELNLQDQNFESFRNQNLGVLNRRSIGGDPKQQSDEKKRIQRDPESYKHHLNQLILDESNRLNQNQRPQDLGKQSNYDLEEKSHKEDAKQIKEKTNKRSKRAILKLVTPEDVHEFLKEKFSFLDQIEDVTPSSEETLLTPVTPEDLKGAKNEENIKPELVLQKLTPKIFLDKNKPTLDVKGVKRRPPIRIKKSHKSLHDQYTVKEEINDLIEEAKQISKNSIRKQKEDEIPLQTVKNKIKETLKYIQVLIQVDFTKNEMIYGELLRLENLKKVIVKEWRTILEKRKYNDLNVKINLLNKMEELLSKKEDVVEAIAECLTEDTRDFNTNNLIKILVRLQKLQCILGKSVEEFGETIKYGKPVEVSKELNHLELLDKIDLIEVENHVDLCGELRRRRDDELEVEVELLDDLKNLLECENKSNRIEEVAKLLWEVNNIAKIQKETFIDMHENIQYGVKIRRELKIIFDLQKHLEGCCEKIKVAFEESNVTTTKPNGLMKLNSLRKILKTKKIKK